MQVLGCGRVLRASYPCKPLIPKKQEWGQKPADNRRWFARASYSRRAAPGCCSHQTTLEIIHWSQDQHDHRRRPRPNQILYTNRIKQRCPSNFDQKSNFEDFVNFWRYVPPKWLQERPHGSKKDPGITLEWHFVESGEDWYQERKWLVNCSGIRCHLGFLGAFCWKTMGVVGCFLLKTIDKGEFVKCWR